jgi:hypothetical protein
MRDMRLLLLCLLMFMLVIASCLAERPGPQRLGLLRTFQQVFYLDDSLSEIKTLKDLQGYLRTVTEQARLLQPLSDYYFKEPEGEIRVFEGVTEGWTKPLVLNIRDLKPRIDTLEWTLTAWAQLETEGGGYIVRKPLGQTSETRELSCWAWYMGWPQDKFEFGAHDYRGGSDAPSTHETLLANGTVADDGTIHFIALVVTLRVCRPPLSPFTIPYRRAHTAPRPGCMPGAAAARPGRALAHQARLPGTRCDASHAPCSKPRAQRRKPCAQHPASCKGARCTAGSCATGARASSQKISIQSRACSISFGIS